MVTVKLYTNKLIVYYENERIAEQQRLFGLQEWGIDIYHYLRTLKRKSGALSQSTALLQADTKIKNIYEQYYSNNPKGFLEVLELIKEKGISEVEVVLKRLSILIPFDLSTDKIKLLCSEACDDTKPGVDAVSEKARQVLVLYDELAFKQPPNWRKEKVICG